jgi:3-deoxy-D-manno-octulosonic-acid transferase
MNSPTNKPASAKPAGAPAPQKARPGQPASKIKTLKIVSKIASLVILPGFALYSLFTGKKKRGLKHHFGWIPVSNKKPGQKLVWVHALSLGEVNGAAPVLKILREKRPNILIALSVTTDAGYDAAQRMVPFADYIFFHPLDSWPFITRALDRLKPDLYVLTDTGFWPSMLMNLKERRIPPMVFNGRISEKSQARYKRVAAMVRPLLQSFAVICMQSERGRTTIQNLGAPPNRVRIVGDTKFDSLQVSPEPERLRIRDRLKIPRDGQVFVAGSTHEGEEKICVDAYMKLRRKFPKLSMVLAPRRLERVEEIAKFLQKENVKFVLRSKIDPKSNPTANIVLLDSLGELSKVYGIADVAFVGRSLVTPGGGHNLLEPVVQGKPVLHGPYVENNQKIASELKTQGLATLVADDQTMYSAIRNLLLHEDQLPKIREKANNYIQSKKGSALEIAKYIVAILK